MHLGFACDQHPVLLGPVIWSSREWGALWPLRATTTMKKMTSEHRHSGVIPPVG